ncbi:MAG: hypothetical protein P8Y27_19650, partial [Chromatiaceae bacterium]
LIQIVVNTLLYVAISRVGVGPGVGLEFLAPIFVVAWDRVTGTARPRRITWAAVVAAVVGVGLLVEAGDLTELDPVGVLAGFGAAVTLASYPVPTVSAVQGPPGTHPSPSRDKKPRPLQSLPTNPGMVSRWRACWQVAKPPIGGPPLRAGVC